jgi:ParB-like chromosome segregation protein Spo0J
LIDLKDLIPYANNPRNNDGEAVDKVAASIHEYGFNVPIVIDKDNVIIAGHTRYKAANKLKYKKVPCIRAEHLSPAQVKAYRLADNKVAEYSSWDDDMLALELEQLQELDFELDLTGFEDDEISKLLDLEEEPEIKETSFTYQEQYGVIVMCENEEEQERIYNELTEQGLSCKVVAT